MPKKMRTTRNLLLMATLLGSALFARAADKEMTIGAIYLDTQGYYAGVRQGVQDAAYCYGCLPTDRLLQYFL